MHRPWLRPGSPRSVPGPPWRPTQGATRGRRAQSPSRTATLIQRETRTGTLAHRIAELVDAGQRLDENVGTATSVMAGLREAIGEIAAAASHATSTANEASAGSREGAATVQRLAETMAE